MADVFISYKSEEISEADWVRTALESNGISCWMAPMSITGGSSYAEEIPQAISESRAFVLILSEKCQLSKWVPRELDQAINEGKTVLPFMLENCPLKADFKFYLSNVQRYPAYEDRSAAVEKMINDINAVLGRADRGNVVKSCPYCGSAIRLDAGFCIYCMRELNEKTVISPPRKKNGKRIVIIAVAAAVLAAVVLSVCVLFGRGETSQKDDDAASPESHDTGETEDEENELLHMFDKKFENDGENGGFSSYVLFQPRAKAVVSSFGRERLWDTDVFSLYSYTDEWYAFRLESCFDDSPFLIFFCNGNEDIIATLSNLDGNQLEDAYLLSECLIDAVDNYYITDIYDFLTDSEKFPWSVMDDPYYNHMAENGLTGDVYANVHDEDADDVYRYKVSLFADHPGDQVLIFGLRERTVNGEKKYDIIFDLYHLEEDAE